jgi:hypothetical protein
MRTPNLHGARRPTPQRVARRALPLPGSARARALLPIEPPWRALVPSPCSSRRLTCSSLRAAGFLPSLLPSRSSLLPQARHGASSPAEAPARPCPPAQRRAPSAHLPRSPRLPVRRAILELCANGAQSGALRQALRMGGTVPKPRDALARCPDPSRASLCARLALTRSGHGARLRRPVSCLLFSPAPAARRCSNSSAAVLPWLCCSSSSNRLLRCPPMATALYSSLLSVKLSWSCGHFSLRRVHTTLSSSCCWQALVCVRARHPLLDLVVELHLAGHHSLLSKVSF